MLPLGDAFLRAVSRSGELAVVVKSDVLARVPIGGAGIRDVKEHVFDADWAPDGSVAVVRQDPKKGRSWVEYPLGKRSSMNSRMRYKCSGFRLMAHWSP